MKNNMFFFVLVLLGLTLSGCASTEGKVHISYSKEVTKISKLLDNYAFDSIEIRLLTGFSNDAIRVRTDKGFDVDYKQVSTNLSITYARTIIVPCSHFMAKRLILTIRDIEYTIPVNYKYLFCDISIDSSNAVNVYYNNEILVLSKHELNKQFEFSYLYATVQRL